MQFNGMPPQQMGMTPPPPMGATPPQPMGMTPPPPMGATPHQPMGSAGGAKPGVVSLSKGQKVSLSKVAPSLVRMMVGLGWDTQKYSGAQDFDLDASVFLCGANDRCDPSNFIFYNNLRGINDCVVHQGDNRTGEGEGDDETIMVDLSKVPPEITKIAVTVTIFEADTRHQNFGMISNAFIRLVNLDTNQEVIRYDLGEDFSIETALVVAELYRSGADWKFSAVGAGFSGGLKALCNNYGIDAE